MKTSIAQNYISTTQISLTSVFLLVFCLSILSVLKAQTPDSENSLLADIQENSVYELPSSLDASPFVETNATSSLPRFKTGSGYASINEYISENMVFPSEARITGAEGIVEVQFEIMEDGSVGDVLILQSPDKAFDETVVQLIKDMPRWTPAMTGQTPVEYLYKLNLNFRLQ